MIEDPLYLSGFDVYNNRVVLSNVPEELHLKLGQLDGEFLDLSVAIPRDRIKLCADNTALELKVNCTFVKSSLLRCFNTTKYQETLCITLQATNLMVVASNLVACLVSRE